MAVGIDNYCLFPLNLSPLEVLKWAEENGAKGVQFSGLNPEVAKNVDEAYLRDLSGYASDKGLYLEWGGAQHIPFDLKTWEEKDITEINQKVAEQAALLGTSLVRSCSGGLMRWDPQSPVTETLLEEMAKSLRAQRQMLMDNNVILAIETHFEFTTHELLRLFDRCEAENLTIEDHGGEFFLPVFDSLFLSKFPDLTAEEFALILRLALQTDEAMKSGEMAITAREEWPKICEARIKRDIQAFKQLI